jgi:hypothetical protein
VRGVHLDDGTEVTARIGTERLHYRIGMAGRHWVHNFKKLLPGCEVTQFKWDVPDEGWDTYGHIIRWEK